MKKILIGLTLFALIASCSYATKPKKPKDLISKDRMINILIDVSLINSAKGINKSILENSGMVPDQYIFEKYQIDSLQFISSNEYYTYNLKDYEDIVNKISDSLKMLRTMYSDLAEKEKEAQRISDSIRISKLPVTKNRTLDLLQVRNEN
ncbi:MAG: DUF4296 domain-containing protein [Xanthomarina sp.]